ncbi:MAG: threonine/serine exporter family protein [Pseudolabrys sp.]
MLFNSSPRTVLAVGLLALGANGLRLVLNDVGVMLAPAAFFAALVIGSVALIVEQRFNVPRMAMAVAPIVIMMPGIYAYEMIVLFNRGPMLDALQAYAVSSSGHWQWV